MSKITFVTAFLNIYETPFEKRDVEWRFTHFRKLAQLGIQLAVFCSPDCFAYMEEMIVEFPNVKIVKYVTLNEMWTYKTCESVQELLLPDVRNIEKDTREYIILQNSKTEFLKDAVEINPWNSTHFAWIDFNIFHVFKDTESYASEYIQHLSGQTFIDKCLVIPGCWGKKRVNHDNLSNHICWRWCGGFLLGDSESILNFHRLYESYFRDFLEKTKRLVWEVNFWAFLEMESFLNATWYLGDHNLSILKIPFDIYCKKLTVDKSRRYHFPEKENYLPSSISWICHKNTNFLNIRYVNYWIYPKGGYLINHPERHIYTKNVCCTFDEETLETTDYNDMKDESVSLVNHGGNIHGIEDIRLYELRGELFFVGSNMNYSSGGRIRIIQGKYNVYEKTFDDCKIVESPNMISWCEKNWIPLIKEGCEYFIYKWCPLQIGVINEKKDDKTNCHQLDIVIQHDIITPIFENVRGSSPFIETDEGFIGVVHFSEETEPRHYYHMLVLLDKTTLKPLKYSNHFYFNTISIEFCIGFSIKRDDYYFWISNFDRDPELVITNQANIPLQNNIVCQ